MKDENKICFNKTLTYLVLLVLAVVGAFYVMNYANSQKLGSTPKAAVGDCKYGNVTIPNGKCARNYVTGWNTTYKCVDGRLNVKDSVNCSSTATTADCTYRVGTQTYTASAGSCMGVPNASWKCISKGVVRKHPDCATPVTAATCTANIITSKAADSSWCRYQTGVRKTNNTCAVLPLYDRQACTPAVGQLLATRTAGVTCTANKIVNVYPDGTCRYEKGTTVNGRCRYGVEDDATACSPGVGKLLGSGTAAVDWTAVRTACEAKKGTVYQQIGPDANGTNTCYVFSGAYTMASKGRSGDNCVTIYKAGTACN